MKPIKTALLALPLLAAGCNRDSGTAKIRPLEAGSVRVEDAFWGPRYEKWEHVTVGDMLNKFEGNDPAHFACGVDAFENFDLVASGARDIGRHAGPPWYDGLVYETIRGISDLLAQRPDPALKARVDGYIARIEAAQ
ncbi:beta-L-arabinofuranosidase domain-containing protein, partial [Alistipes onderdonkii]|uniref:beta-L-arabinofuranosidase domain-containing protein n=2 Tax=Alistipes TaxID=239759 RepID=UPI0018A8CA2A